MLKNTLALFASTLVFGAPLAVAADDAELTTYTCRPEGLEAIVSEKDNRVYAFVFSTCSNVGCMTLGLDKPEDGKLQISTNYLDGSTVDVSTTARMSDDGILINSPILIGQFGTELTTLVGFANDFLDAYSNGNRDALSCNEQVSD
tara:strand:- start:15717 stop:16154 length:438 start_codon:yes stop_codon:yes gene_type:complete